MLTFGYTWRAVVLAIAVVLAVAAPAAAMQPQATTFALHGHLTGPATTTGTWTSTGFVDDAGTYTETFRFAGGTIHVEKVLVGSKGTIVLRVDAVTEWIDACTATFRAGAWRVAAGTGAYEELKAGGAPAVEAGSFGDVCTGAVEIVHDGQAHA